MPSELLKQERFPESDRMVIRITSDIEFVQTVYAFRYDIGERRGERLTSCENCGAAVLPEWQAQHVVWHFTREVAENGGIPPDL